MMQRASLAARVQKTNFLTPNHKCAPSLRRQHRIACRSQAPDPKADSNEVPSIPETSTSERTSYGISYPVVTALATAGLAETAYLTFVKLFNTPLVCPTSGCETVLTSEYSTLFGVPLSFLGMLAYGAVGILSSAASRSTQDLEQRNLNSALLAGACLLATCSGALLYILQTQFSNEPCAWCYLSAGLSFTLLGTVAAGLGPRRLQDAMGPGLGAVATTAAVLYFGFGSMGTSNAQITELSYYSPTVTTESSRQAVDLAQRLRDAGAKMYGAFWCSHCYDQKQTFGKQAMAAFPYVECYPSGWQKGIKVDAACEAAGVRAFPTWVINGKLIEGELSLEEVTAELAAAEAGAAAPAGAPAVATQ
mmetsp:Transcript_16018/g.34607  ORF Transcript_16018/g.34607 Transcript_16018/m.34607 type:complete len:363 (+) Transcript_16018:47-1135(+)